MGRPTNRLRALTRLNWLSVPSRLAPHGLTGAGMLAIGLGLMMQTLAGSFAGVASPPVLGSFCLLSIANAAGGWVMAARAPKAYQPGFRYSAAFQVCLTYYCWRFSPACASWSLWKPWIWTLLDVSLAAATMLGIASFTMTALLLPAAIAVALLVGSAALLLLAAYPVQLALGGEEWWRCVQAAYPMQAAGMTGCIYVPATTAFAAMLFGATLWNRKLLSTTAFGGGFTGVVLATLFATVLMQEVHIPAVSTQKIYIPCPAPPPNSLAAQVEKALNVSALAQSVLARMR